MDRNAFNTAFTTAVAVGQVAYVAPGVYDLVVPPNCYSMSAVAVGAGQAGGSRVDGSSTGYGGAGGDLRYIRSFAVTPGEVLRISVGAGGRRNANLSGPAGGATTITRLSTGEVILRAACRAGSLTSTTLSSNVGGGSGGLGGANAQARGGAGAGGYSGAGGQSFHSESGIRNGQGGGGSAGGNGLTNSDGGGGGGGVGIYGEGASGVAFGSDSNREGVGGSNGSNGAAGVTQAGQGYGGQGGSFGGGGGGQESGSNATIGGTGGDGAARLIWPADQRQYPSTETQDY